MSKVSIYLNFAGNTEAAFNYYKQVFGTEFSEPMAFHRDLQSIEGMPPLPENELDKVMHVSLPILGGFVIMGTDMLESMGRQLRLGNNAHINLEPDTREEADRLYAALSDGGDECQPLQDMFWGAYWGSCRDRFGVSWMINCANTPR